MCMFVLFLVGSVASIVVDAVVGDVGVDGVCSIDVVVVVVVVGGAPVYFTVGIILVVLM